MSEPSKASIEEVLRILSFEGSSPIIKAKEIAEVLDKYQTEIAQLEEHLGRNALAHHLKSSDLYEEIKFLKSRLSKVRNFLKSLLVENISIDNVKEMLKEIGE